MNSAVVHPPTRVDGVGSPFDLAVSVLDGEGFNFGYNIVLSNVNGSDDWNNMRVFWGTGWCANDSIDGTASVAPVPIPAALPMMLAALSGLFFVARRKVA